ncbi:MAG: hypothetical protein WAW96_04425, partial [Alphaproteobacteria bacterium]
MAALITLSFGPAAGANCEDTAKAGLEACMKRGEDAYKNATLGSGDFTYIKTCTDDYNRAKASCSPAPVRVTSAEKAPPGCEEAKINIDWVLLYDKGAQQRYVEFVSQGQSPYEAVISAQAHNPHAQDTIRKCASWSR